VARAPSCSQATSSPRPDTVGLRTHTRNNDRRANEGADVDANTDGDAPPLFRRALRNLAPTAMLLCSYLEVATSEERQVIQHLKTLLGAAAAQQAESSASRQRSERGRGAAPSAHGPNPPRPDIKTVEKGPGSSVASQ
jgi:hypothetical protein